MRIELGYVLGQVVMKTEDLPYQLLEAMADILGLPRGGSVFLIGEKGVGYELFVALAMAKAYVNRGGVDIKVLRNPLEPVPVQIEMACNILKHQVQGSNGYQGAAALVIRDHKPCTATYGKMTFFVGLTSWVDEKLVGRQLYARAELNDFTFAIVEDR